MILFEAVCKGGKVVMNGRREQENLRMSEKVLCKEEQLSNIARGKKL
jgi:hypothetical protein